MMPLSERVASIINGSLMSRGKVFLVDFPETEKVSDSSDYVTNSFVN